MLIAHRVTLHLLQTIIIAVKHNEPSMNGEFWRYCYAIHSNMLETCSDGFPNKSEQIRS